jgi:phage recombination protein Bet
MTQITGELTDYALMTEGVHQGRYAARIDDKPYPVQMHVDPFLLRLQKGQTVDVTLKNVDGTDWISKIKRSTVQKPVTKTEKKPMETDIAGDAIERAKAKVKAAKDKESAEMKAKLAHDEEMLAATRKAVQEKIQRDPAVNEKLKNAGFNQPDPIVAMKVKAAEEILQRVAQEQALQVVPADTPQQFNKDQISLIKATVARNCTDTEFELLMYLAAQYHLDPIRKQIWAVKYGNAPASIFTGRDGFLEIAHRSGQFDGMESGIREEGDEIIGWCKVYRKDMSHAFYVEVFLKEYQKPVPMSGKPGTWQTMPKVMIQKVAESSCLRRAFSVSGLYCPEEMPDSGGA